MTRRPNFCSKCGSVMRDSGTSRRYVRVIGKAIDMDTITCSRDPSHRNFANIDGEWHPILGGGHVH